MLRTDGSDGGAAFPHNGDNGFARPDVGMSLRDYFAAKALSGLCADPQEAPDDNEELEDYYRRTAEAAYGLADAMLAERDK